MITKKEFITMSIDLNLFFLRIMKEHSLFLEIAFTQRDRSMGAEAASFRMGFERLLEETVELANGNIGRDILQSRQIATQFTKDAERLTTFYTGVPIDMSITERELSLAPAGKIMPADITEEVEALDRRAYQLTAKLAEFKERILSHVHTCKMLTFNYPLLIDHILREAKLFMRLQMALIRGENIVTLEDLISQEAFWNRIMAEHSKFIMGLLDPTEENLIDTARNFGKEFDVLTAEAIQATNQALDASGVTAKSLDAARRLRDFKTTGTKGLLDCTIQSIIVPLLGDHVMREANHYLCILGECGSMK